MVLRIVPGVGDLTHDLGGGGMYSLVLIRLQHGAACIIPTILRHLGKEDPKWLCVRSPQAQVAAAFHTDAFVFLRSLGSASSFQLRQAHSGFRGVGLTHLARTVERLGVTCQPKPEQLSAPMHIANFK